MSKTNPPILQSSNQSLISSSLIPQIPIHKGKEREEKERSD
ncbi:hypothetical protein BofuT4_uP080600.1 [Botrytis cinerea T4]|uniref:Uncharacterized protein n=1 Tax=Botryotinia fuckeliana (strain T4) TaxID=999810 RepID=G2YKW7_BOTF4|nr:hypothetical protein BofuT4_uP080600.1 [Botrytis cinerea T4]